MVRMIISNGIRNRSTSPLLKWVHATQSHRPRCESKIPIFNAETLYRASSIARVDSGLYSSTTRNVGAENKDTRQSEAKTAVEKPAVKVVEVGPRDGLQNEPLPLVSVKDKLEFIRRLERAGCSNIEVGSFVSPKWIPQMSGSAEVLSGLLESPCDILNGPRYSILIPNLKGLEQALSVENDPGGGRIDEIAIFGAASEEFTKRNINSTIDESMDRFREIVNRVREVQRARENFHDRPLLVRGYVSTVIACPYEGAIKPKKVAEVVEKMLDLGCHEISLGDTIGVGTPESTKQMLDEVMKVAKPSQLAMHCHDTYGQALVNILTGLEKEIYTIDSSVAGLGGCPYAKGASGNVATEDVLYMLHGMGLSTGIDLEKLFDAGQFICKVLDRPTLSKVAMASSSIG
mmetsp:Transcript_18563/g.38251  ORF Transcript_18563/g.38251 Transcript_18563/m.38251 type:complete len:403 (+) Transcript_18563:134-1342(+)